MRENKVNFKHSTRLTLRRLFETRPPVLARDDGHGRRALGLAQRVLGDDAHRAVVVLAHARHLEDVDHPVVSQLEAVALRAAMIFHIEHHIHSDQSESNTGRHSYLDAVRVKWKLSSNSGPAHHLLEFCRSLTVVHQGTICLN